MLTTFHALLGGLLLFQSGATQPADPNIQADVDRLVLAAQQLK